MHNDRFDHPKMWMATTALGLTLAAAQNPTASAQTIELPPASIEEERNDDYKVDTISSPKYTSPVLDTPQSITIINQQLMKERGATSITEALRTTPGISLGAGEGGIPFGDRAFIRGFDSRTDMFVDGARNFGAYQRDPFNLEQLELVKGPGSVYAGRGSTGGSINLATKAPRQGEITDASVTLGSDMTKRATFDYNRSLDAFDMKGVAVRINGVAHDAEVAGRDEVEKQHFGIAPSISFGLGTDTRTTLSYYHVTYDDMPDYGHPFDRSTGQPVKVDRDNFYGLLGRDQDKVQGDILTAKIEHDLRDNITLRNQLRFDRTLKDYIVTKPEYTPGATTVTRASRSRNSHDEILINQTDATIRLKGDTVDHDIVFGVELSREESRNTNRTIPVATAADLANPDPNAAYTAAIVPASLGTTALSYSTAVYAFDTIKFGKMFELSGGLRLDRFDTTYTPTNHRDLERTDTPLSYRLGGVYKPAPNGSVYVAYGTSTNPSAEGLTLSDATVILAPEETVSYELGTKWDLLGNRLNVTGALFRTDKTNARTTSDASVQTLDGEQRVQGIEAGISGSITDKWKVFGGLTLMESEVLASTRRGETGHELANVPTWTASLWSTYDIAKDFDIGGGVYHMTDRYVATTSYAELPGYWRFDALLGYELTEKVRLQFNVQNIGDSTYYDSAHSTQHALVAPGRTFLLTTDFKF